MELSQIRYFILTAQLQNMSQAARALHITQPTLSKSIANLERELGVRLFDRTGKKLKLNERGKRFLERAIISVQELDSAAEAAQSHATQDFLRLGLFHVSQGFLRSISNFSLQNPHVVLQIDCITESDESIDTNLFDMLLYPRSTQFHRYTGRPLFTESYGLAFSKSNPLSLKRVITMSDLQNQKLIFIKSQKNLYELPFYVCKSSGLSPASAIVTNSHAVQQHLISSGCGIGFVSEGTADLYRSGSDVEIRELTGVDMRQEVMIGFKRAKHLSESGRRLSTFIVDYYKPLKGEGSAGNGGRQF